MYSIVLATVLTAGAAAPDHGWRAHGCHGCYGACYGACYGVCYGGWCHGCSGCWGGSSCWGCSGCSGCYGGWWGCCGCSGCFGGCGGCYGGCCSAYLGCYGGCCGVTVAPAVTYPAPPVTYSEAAPAPVIINGSAPPAPPVNGSAPIHPAPAPTPAPAPAPAPNSPASAIPATVVIKAAKDVTVTVNGQETKRSSEAEVFRTPELVVGRTYAYDVAAEATREGRTVTLRKRVTVRAGERTEVDFGDMSQAVAAHRAETARITVLLPEGGKLFVDGQEVGSSTRQTFDTPKLAKGKTYFYTLKVEVKSADNVGARTQRVNVEAGRDFTVDFRNLFVATR